MSCGIRLISKSSSYPLVFAIVKMGTFFSFLFNQKKRKKRWLSLFVMWCFLLMFFISYFTVHSYWMVHAYFKVTNLCSLSSTLKISSPKSSTGNSCLWNCLFWEIHHCHTTCPTVELAKCLTGKFILRFSLWECYIYMCFWLLIALVFTHFWHVCYFFLFFIIMTDGYGLWIATHINRVCELNGLSFLFPFYEMYLHLHNVKFGCIIWNGTISFEAV